MPDRDDLKKALGLMKTRADYEYFFSQLRSASWLPVIVEEGLLKNPPNPIREGDNIRFPAWPESTFLARVAGDLPKVAAAALRQMPDTDNVRVHEDLLATALKLEPSDAAKWAKRT